MTEKREATVLLVDRSDIGREIIARFVRLKLPTLQVHTADSLTAAVEYCISSRVDIVIIDLGSNEQLNSQYVNDIRLTNDQIKFILVTSRGDLEEIPDFSCDENCTVARIPLDLRELLVILNKLVLVVEE